MTQTYKTVKLEEVTVFEDSPPVDNFFGYRLRCARQLLGLSQDKLGVLIGLDEHTASARISRYETGAHEPPIKTARLLASVLGVPLAYLYCEDNRIAALIVKAISLTDEQWDELTSFLINLDK